MVGTGFIFWLDRERFEAQRERYPLAVPAPGFPLEDVDLAELISDLLEDIRFEASGRRVTVNCRNLPNFQVRANGFLLHRAIENRHAQRPAIFTPFFRGVGGGEEF